MTEQYPQNGQPPVAPQPSDAGYQPTYQQPTNDAYQQAYQQPVGQPTYQQPVYTQAAPLPQEVDSGSFGWAVLGFFFPIVGLILFIVWRQSKPKCAKMSGIGALVGVGISIAFSILGAILGVLLMPLALYY